MSYVMPNDAQDMCACAAHILPKNETRMRTDATHDAIGICINATHNDVGMWENLAHNDDGMHADGVYDDVGIRVDATYIR